MGGQCFFNSRKCIFTPVLHQQHRRPSRSLRRASRSFGAASRGPLCSVPRGPWVLNFWIFSLNIGDFWPLQPKWAIPSPITIQDMRFLEMMIIWQMVPLKPPTCTMIIVLMLIVFSPVFHKLCAGHSGHCYLTLLTHNLMVIVMLAALMICLYKGVSVCDRRCKARRDAFTISGLVKTQWWDDVNCQWWS